ncbi:hypothetical protein BDV96DRAFT_642986 [Lophiotrema nucula]|uniref:Uncharacterized protein n=1 Tax=Lophiotrema nucula TaxID=690887 RepID=A0A6A5ZHU9_9PLEO|nr:hypothetical protein BDV96DRAFT_642986 [Lophiotrema nucula]
MSASNTPRKIKFERASDSLMRCEQTVNPVHFAYWHVTVPEDVWSTIWGGNSDYQTVIHYGKTVNSNLAEAALSLGWKVEGGPLIARRLPGVLWWDRMVPANGTLDDTERLPGGCGIWNEEFMMSGILMDFSPVLKAEFDLLQNRRGAYQSNVFQSNAFMAAIKRAEQSRIPVAAEFFQCQYGNIQCPENNYWHIEGLTTPGRPTAGATTNPIIVRAALRCQWRVIGGGHLPNFVIEYIKNWDANPANHLKIERSSRETRVVPPPFDIGFGPWRPELGVSGNIFDLLLSNQSFRKVVNSVQREEPEIFRLPGALMFNDPFPPM